MEDGGTYLPVGEVHLQPLAVNEILLANRTSLLCLQDWHKRS